MYEMIPDRVIRPSLSFTEAARQRTLTPRAMTIRPGAKQIQLNLTGVQVIDNHEIGKAEVYIISTVIDGISKDPVVVELKTYKEVKDGDTLPIVPPGVTLYQNLSELPPFLDWRLLIAESDSPYRETGELLKTLAKDDDWKSITATLKAALSTGNPVGSVIVGLVDGLVGVIGRIMELNKDDQIGYLAVSYNKSMDDLGVGEHKALVSDAWVKWNIRTE